MPEPNQRGYQQALEETLIALCTATGGRALVLFTANSALRMTYKAIQEPLEEQGIAVLGQGLDGSRRSLLERFKEFPRTVLLGTTSFWEGVDVVGDALSALVIAKLPFSVPNDPIFAARSEGFADAFNEYAVPQAILRFKQGFGRLIRSREDRGVVAVLDKRLLSKKYGQIFLDSLPHTKVRTGPAKQLPLLAARFLV
jgi:DNA polymerase III subunit epsilon